MTDPVLARRARIARMVSVGQRVGYLLFAAAIVLFFVGFIARFTNALTSVILACLVIGSIVLAPAIVLGYGVKAAEREEREEAEARRARDGGFDENPDSR